MSDAPECVVSFEAVQAALASQQLDSFCWFWMMRFRKGKFLYTSFKDMDQESRKTHTAAIWSFKGQSCWILETKSLGSSDSEKASSNLRLKGLLTRTWQE